MSNIEELTKDLITVTVTAIEKSLATMIEIPYFGKTITGISVDVTDQYPVSWANRGIDITEPQKKELENLLGNLIVQNSSFVTQFNIDGNLYRHQWKLL